MTVKELKEILEWLDEDLEIVIEDLEGRKNPTVISIFKNVDGDTVAILE